MAVRTDITINHVLDPRIAEISSASNEIIVQDSHDTLRNIEDNPSSRLYPKLVETDGKNDLSGGTEVGLTTALQNVQYAPQRPGSLSSGTVTTADTDGLVLIDSLATFQTDGVKRGYWVLNFTDQSVTEVLTVDSEIQLTCRALSDGTDNQFGLNDAYKVWEVSVFSMVGGNFTAIDELGATINPYFTTFGRTIAITASSSATLANQAALEAGLFFDGVVIDANNPYSASTSAGLAGTHATPAINDVVALAVSNRPDRALLRYLIIGTNTLTADHSAGRLFRGSNASTSIVVLAGANVSNCTFESCFITGAGSTNMALVNAYVSNLSGITGVMLGHSGIQGTLTPASGTLQLNGTVGLPGTTLDMSVSGSIIVGVHLTGSFEITNKTTTDLVALTFDVGSTVTIAASCTSPPIIIDGECEIINNSPIGDAILTDNTTTTKLDSMYKADFNKRKRDAVAKTITLYEADGVTPFKVFDTNDDVSDITPQ